MGEEQSIDLEKIFQIALNNKKILLGIIGACVIIALLAALILPNKYTSSVLVRAKSPQNTISMQAMAASALLGGGSLGTTLLQSYQEMMKSRSVLEPVIAKLDLPDEEKAEITSESFAKKTLDISSTKGTDLLKISAMGKTPEEAQFIAQSVVESFRQTLTNLNQSEQSLQMKFLNNRIKVAQEEMEQAERNLEAFRQQSKLYVPDEQASAVIDILSEYDKRLAQLQTENQTNRAKAQGVEEQLRQHNLSLSEYNIAENAIVNQIRSAIVNKEIELVELEQRYTDKHPDVILTKEEIKKLTLSLQEEIDQSIRARTNVLNPVHGYLLQEKAIAETGIISTDAAINAMKEAQAKVETQISEMSANTLTYIGLERKTLMSQEVYKVLITNYEQTRIQEAMESMDIQVVDAANLPLGPSWPNKILFVAIGFILGVVISFGWVLVLYSRNENNYANLTGQIPH